MASQRKHAKSGSLPGGITLFIERLRLRYDLKREYFTIGVPVAVALLFIAGMLLSGMTQIGGDDGGGDQKSDRQKAYEELLRQEEAEEQGVELTPEEVEEPQEEEEKIGIDHVLIIATLVAITPYGFDITLQKMRRRKKEELYTEFLFKLSEMMRGGLDPIKSVMELAKTDLGALNTDVRVCANSMKFGKSFEEAMKQMAKNLDSELIARYTELVIQASYSGGSVADLILKSSEDMRGILGIEREKEGNLRQYVAIFYMAQGIIFFIAYTLNTSLLPFFSDVGSSGFGGIGGAEIAEIDFTQGFFHLIMLNALLGGLIIGKISEGDVRYGLKHATILVGGCYVASLLMLLPAGAGEELIEANVTIISGFDQEGLVGLPLKEPIVVSATDLEGNPLSRTTVTFGIDPGGSVEPETVKTNEKGEATVRVTLGATEGTYAVSATVGATTARTTAVAMGG
ncbi:MAG: type II secretion system F family protein [Methanoculleus sp.]|nr:type II secretion system F family protein [Methanoculleus sp.]